MNLSFEKNRVVLTGKDFARLQTHSINDSAERTMPNRSHVVICTLRVPQTFASRIQTQQNVRFML